jgi:hypothetical protein
VIPNAHEAFKDDGTLKDTAQQDAVRSIGARLATVVGRLHG